MRYYFTLRTGYYVTECARQGCTYARACLSHTEAVRFGHRHDFYAHR